MEEIRERLNNATDDFVDIVTILPTNNIQGSIRVFKESVAPSLNVHHDISWVICEFNTKPNEMVTFCFMRIKPRSEILDM